MMETLTPHTGRAYIILTSLAHPGKPTALNNAAAVLRKSLGK